MNVKNKIWRNIKGYEGLYQINREGEIKSLSRVIQYSNGKITITKDIILKPSKGKNGYEYVFLYKNKQNKKYNVHRLVAQTFILNPKNKPTVNHINSVRNDNRVENLEWATYSENMKHGYLYGNVNPSAPMKGRFGEDNPLSKPVFQMSRLNKIMEVYPSISEASILTGINQSNISATCLNKRKTAGGFIWNFI